MSTEKCMAFCANFGSGKEQYGDSGDGEKGSEDRLPADLFLKDEVADWQKDNGGQCHQHGWLTRF
jgi:hypothetical protein